MNRSASGREPTARAVLVAATANRHKVAEMEPVLAPALSALGAAFRPLSPADAEECARRGFVEDRSTFAGNAAVKALGASEVLGLVSLGEDSGLEVEALGGEPGVRSARWSGGGPAENNRLLLEKLAGLPADRRAARFRAVVAVKVPRGPLYVAEGTSDGNILTEPRGQGGFGYDPVFLSVELGRTFAEVPAGQKAKVSHRARALRAIRGYLFEAFGGWPRPEEDGPPPRPGAAGTRTGATPSTGVPGHDWCLNALREARCPEGLLQHQLAVSRLCRETALLLCEAGRVVEPVLAAAAGLLHDIGKTGAPPEAGPCPPGVTPHAWLSAAWAAERGLDPRLVRAVMVHGLDSLVCPDYEPRSWEERVLMLCDKLAEFGYASLEQRLDGLRRRHPSAAGLIDKSEPRLRNLEVELAAACGLSPERFEKDLSACLDVAVLAAGAGSAEAEQALGDRAADSGTRR